MERTLLAMALGLLASGCMHTGEVWPAAAAERVAELPRAAVTEAAGVRLTADAGAWHGTPPNLESAVVPVRVRIDNDSRHMLRVRYQEFTFRGPVLDYHPLPPRKLVDRSITEQEDPMLVPRTLGSGCHALPYQYPNFPHAGSWDLPWESDPDFYARQYAKWTVSLPTMDMIDAALPEGALEPGGHVEGFLYFEHFRSSTRELQLRFDLVDARSELSYGTLALPFVQH
jgi:hypothetical protein